MRPEKKKDVGEKGLDPEVHGLVSRNNMVPPIPNARRKEAYDPNGSDPSAQDAPDLPGKFKYAQRALSHIYWENDNKETYLLFWKKKIAID